jgi:predicted metal-binding membrane protein
MAAVTVLIVAEKMLPRGELFSRVTGGTLILVGAGWLVLLVLA